MPKNNKPPRSATNTAKPTTGPASDGPAAQPVDRRGSGSGGPPPGLLVDRRIGLDRGKPPRPGTGRRASATDGFTDPDRRRGVGRRLSDFARAAEEGEMTREQFLFLSAIDAFKRANNKTFPTWTEILEVIRLLGYRKTAPSELNLQNAEDWLEAANAPANVRTHTSKAA